MGLREVKDAGGITFVQDERSAKFDGMPGSPIATGAVDFIMPPQEIAAELAGLYSKLKNRPEGEDPVQPSLDRIWVPGCSTGGRGIGILLLYGFP